MDSALHTAIAVCNRKGGVGKTSLSCHLAGLVASETERVLLVDLDPQGNTHLDLGYPLTANPELLIALEYGPQIVTPSVLRDVRPGLDVLIGGPQLSAWTDKATTLAKERPAEHIHTSLRRLLHHYAGDYALIVIDCPPGDHALQMLALAAATFVVCPIKSDAASFEGLQQFAELFTEVRDGGATNGGTPLNPDLQVLGVAHLFCPSNAAGVRRHVEAQVEALFGTPGILLRNGVRHSERAATHLRQYGLLTSQYADNTSSPAALHGVVPAGRRSSAANALAADWQRLVREVIERYLTATNMVPTPQDEQ